MGPIQVLFSTFKNKFKKKKKIKEFTAMLLLRCMLNVMKIIAPNGNQVLIPEWNQGNVSFCQNSDITVIYITTTLNKFTRARKKIGFQTFLSLSQQTSRYSKQNPDFGNLLCNQE